MGVWAKEPRHRVNITEENAEFIVNAREDIPALLEEVNRLQNIMSHINDCAEEFFIEKGGIYELPEDMINRDFLQEIFIVSSENSNMRD